MSMYSTECICMACKEKEKTRDDYEAAVQAELDEVRRGNTNYKGSKGERARKCVRVCQMGGSCLCHDGRR